MPVFCSSQPHRPNLVAVTKKGRLKRPARAHCRPRAPLGYLNKKMFLCYNAGAVQAGMPMTVKEMGLAVATRRVFFYDRSALCARFDTFHLAVLRLGCAVLSGTLFHALLGRRRSAEAVFFSGHSLNDAGADVRTGRRCGRH